MIGSGTPISHKITDRIAVSQFDICRVSGADIQPAPNAPA